MWKRDKRKIMMKIKKTDKIINIITYEETIFGLSESGNLYRLANDYIPYWIYECDSPKIKIKDKNRKQYGIFE